MLVETIITEETLVGTCHSLVGTTQMREPKRVRTVLRNGNRAGQKSGNRRRLQGEP